jgi:GMP synthase PP-ATPase subunit
LHSQGSVSVIKHRFMVESFTDDEHFKLMLPFGKTNRSEVIKIGQWLGVDYVNTWRGQGGRS